MDFDYVRRWKETTRGDVIGILPVYFPKEILHAAGVLPIDLYGGGDIIDVVQGDSYYQSYICHIPRSMIDLGLSGRLNFLSGLICPFTCDVIRNFSGVWGMLFPDQYARFFDQPQNFDPEIGGEYLTDQLNEIMAHQAARGRTATTEQLNRSIFLYNENRRLIRRLYEQRVSQPWQIPAHEAYVLLRASGIMRVEESNALLRAYLADIGSIERKAEDKVRVIVSGAFCEQPSASLLRTIELSGCYIINDDFLLGNRYLDTDVEISDDPVRAISRAYLQSRVPSSCRFEEYDPKSARLVSLAQEQRADGVIFACPSFCDPALEDQPSYQQELEEAGIPFMTLQYSEDTRQFNVIREQVGTFSDSIRLAEATHA